MYLVMYIQKNQWQQKWMQVWRAEISVSILISNNLMDVCVCVYVDDFEDSSNAIENWESKPR